jgi:hypothetical protein
VTATHRLFVPGASAELGYKPVPPHGSLRFLNNLSTPAVPFTPESLSDDVRYGSDSGRLRLIRQDGHSQWCNGANWDSLAFALRLTFSLADASGGRLLRHPHGELHVERTIHMVNSFQLTRSVRLTDAPEDTEVSEGCHTCWPVWECWVVVSTERNATIDGSETRKKRNTRKCRDGMIAGVWWRLWD